MSTFQVYAGKGYRVNWRALSFRGALVTSYNGAADLTCSDAACAVDGAPLASANIFTDHFTDADGTDVSSHTPDVGGAWANFGGSNAKIESNQATGDVGVADAQGQYQDATAADYTLSVSMTNGQSSSWPVVLLRLDPMDGSGYYLTNQGTINQIQLYEYDGGSYSLAATAGVTLLGTDAFEFVLAGANLQINVNGSPVLTYGSMTRNPSSTYCGFSLYDQAHNATVSIDDFLINVAAAGGLSFTRGRATMTLTLNTAGSQTVTATDTLTDSITGTLYFFVSAALDHFQVDVDVTDITAGDTVTATITPLDAMSAPIPFYYGPPELFSADPLMTLGTVTDLNPIWQLQAALYTAGTLALTAADTATPTISGVSADITVHPGPQSSFVVTGPDLFSPTNPFDVTVRVIDAYGNTVTSYSGTVSFTSSDPMATLPPDDTLTSGVGTFVVTLLTSGTQTVTATDIANSLTGTGSFFSSP